MFSGHEGLEIGGEDVLGAALVLGLLHEQAVGHAPEEA